MLKSNIQLLTRQEGLTNTPAPGCSPLALKCWSCLPSSLKSLTSYQNDFYPFFISCADGGDVSCSATRDSKRPVFTCPSVTDIQCHVYRWFYHKQKHRLHPLFLSHLSEVGFLGIPENHEKLAHRTYTSDSAGPFLTFFLKKSRLLSHERRRRKPARGST